MRGTDDCVSSKPPLYFKAFSCAHIYQGQVSIGIHHQILGFKIAIDDSIGVEVFHHEKDLANQEAGMLYREGDNFGDDIEQVLSFNELHYEIDKVCVLEKFVEADNKWVARHGSQYFLFVHDVLNDLGFLNVLSVQHLYGIQFGCFSVVADVDFSEVPLSQLTYYLKVANLHLFLEQTLFLIDCWFFFDFDRDRAGPCFVKLAFNLAQFSLVLGDHVLVDLDGLPAGDLIQLNNRVGVKLKILALESGVEKDKYTVFILSVFLQDDLSFFKVDKLSIFEALSQLLEGNCILKGGL